jgi:hypothetical protein
MAAISRTFETGAGSWKSDAVSIYFLDATLASAFVARWCAGSGIETDGGVYRIRDDEPTPRIGAAPHVQHAAHPRRRYRPAIGAVILIEPCGNLRMALAKAAGRNATPDADGIAPLGHCDHLREPWNVIGK